MPVEPLRDVAAVPADRRWVDWAVARLHADGACQDVCVSESVSGVDFLRC